MIEYYSATNFSRYKIENTNKGGQMKGRNDTKYPYFS